MSYLQITSKGKDMVKIEVRLEEQEQSRASCDSFLARKGKDDPRFFMGAILDDGWRWHRLSRM